MATMINWRVKRATHYLTAGGVIAYPTEAVYGLGCNPFNQQAVYQLLTLKQRDWRKGLILIAADYEQLRPLLKPLTPEIEQRVFASWPGHVTWLLPARPEVPKWLRGLSDKLAVRVTAHPVAASLCQYWQAPLVSTSANLSQHTAAKTAWQVRRTFKNSLAYIVSDKVGNQAKPSEMRDALTNKLLRA